MRKPPSDKEIEKALLWTMLIDSDILEQYIEEWGQIEWFYHYKDIMEKFFQIWLEWRKLDLVVAWNELKGKIEKYWWFSFLSELTDLASSFLWKEYFNTLSVLYKQREIMKIGNVLIDVWNESEDTLNSIIEKWMTSLNEVMKEWVDKWITKVEDNIKLLEHYIEQNKNKELIWWSWWIDWLDKETGWIRKSKTYRIGAPSGVWKSNLIYWIIVDLLEQWAKVQFVSLENSIETTYTKLLSAKQRVNPYQIEKGLVEPNYEWLKKYKDSFILTDQLFELSEIKRSVIKNKPDVLFLDYIWLVNIKGHTDKEIFDRYAKEMKEFIQKQQNVALIDISNLNKSDDEEKIRREKGFNWSAALRNNTDVALHMFYYQPFYNYKKSMLLNSPTEEIENFFRGKQVITFLLSKNRMWVDGVEKTFQIDFNKWIRYEEVDGETLEKWSF